MIGYLSGRLLRYRNGIALVEAGGVGYEVHYAVIPAAHTFAGFGPPENATLCTRCGATEDGDDPCSATASLFIHHHQTERGDTLYGFADAATLDVFRELLKVQEVGPKAAALVLNAVGVKGVLRACAAKEPMQLAGVAKGVGPKTAARIVAELPESVIREFAPELLGAVKTATKAPASDVERDAESALRHMGYAAKEAREAIAATEDAERAELQRLLAASLKLLGRKKG